MLKATFLILPLFALGKAQLVKDLFYKSSGSTISRFHKSCSHSCNELSSKMVTFDLTVPENEDCPQNLDLDQPLNYISVQNREKYDHDYCDVSFFIF